MSCTCDKNIHCFIDKKCPEHGTREARSRAEGADLTNLLNCDADMENNYQAAALMSMKVKELKAVVEMAYEVTGGVCDAKDCPQCVLHRAAAKALLKPREEWDY